MTGRRPVCILVLCLLAPAGCSVVREREATSHYVRGRHLAAAGRTRAALRELSRAVEVDPELWTAHEAIGDIRRQRREHTQAADAYRAACDTNPYAFRPHYNLGVTCQLLAEAARVADEVRELLGEAARVYVRAVTLRPDDFDANLNLSACYFQLGKHMLAERYSRTAIEARPNSAEAWSNLGIILDAQGHPYGAIRAFKASLERDSAQPTVLMNLGDTYVRQGRLTTALEAFAVAVEQEPDSPAAWQRIGSCRFRLRRFAEARRAFERAVELAPASAASHRGLGAACMSEYVLTGDGGDPALRDQALAAWNISLELDPDQPDLLKLVEKYAPKYAAPSP